METISTAASDRLMQLTPFEQMLRSHFQKHGDYCPHGRLQQHKGQFKKNDLLLSGISETENQTNVSGGISLPESRYVGSGEDLAVLKHPRYLYPQVHQHSFFELLYVFEGKCINIIDNSTQKLGEGNVCIIPPNVEHSVAVNDDNSLVLNFVVRASTFNQSFTDLLNSNDVLSAYFNEVIYSNRYRKYLLFHTRNTPAFKQTALAMFDVYRHKDSFYNRIINGYFMVLMGTLLQMYDDSVEYPESYIEKYNVTPKLISYIASNSEYVTLEDCAKRFHFSQRYLGRLVKKETGCTFPQYVTRIRIQNAKNLILQNNLSIEEIASKLGFYDSSYFIRVFKKEMGCTPSDYRNKHSENTPMIKTTGNIF